MLRIAHGSDSHFGIPHRHDEVVRIHNWIANDVAAREVDAFVHTGDLYHGTTTPATRRDAIEWLLKIAALCPVYVLLGNHEKAGELDILGHLAAKHPIVPITVPSWIDIQGLTMLAIPWPRRGNLAGSASTLGEMNQAGSAALSGLIRSRKCDIIAAHIQVTEARVGGGELLSPADVVLSTADLATSGAKAVMLGHIHKPQFWDVENRCTISYAGSPLPLDWGDEGDRMYQIWEIRDSGLPCLEFRRTPHRRMVTIDLGDEWIEWSALGPDSPLGQVGEGDEVRIRYSFRPDQTQLASSWWAMMSDLLKAVGCIPTGDPRVTSARREVRAEALEDATTDHERLKVWLDHRNIPADGAMFERLCGKLDSLKGGEA